MKIIAEREINKIVDTYWFLWESQSIQLWRFFDVTLCVFWEIPSKLVTLYPCDIACLSSIGVVFVFVKFSISASDLLSLRINDFNPKDFSAVDSSFYVNGYIAFIWVCSDWGSPHIISTIVQYNPRQLNHLYISTWAHYPIGQQTFCRTLLEAV